ncbi:hypothetical protein AVANS14531_07130 [Campylobacter sp. Cr9]|uniref:hypothetical protein n=1 Tax=Campylobacter sp. Cr9 TaxID=2735728 RepID=UPI003014AB55|nr:hypothetical protein [Campylobacter sp. Cr9]
MIKSELEFDYFRIYTECDIVPSDATDYEFSHEFLLGDLANYIKLYKNNDKFYIKIFSRIFEIEQRSFNKADVINNLKNIQNDFFIYPKKDQNSTDYRYLYALFANTSKPLESDFNDTLNIASYMLRNSHTLDKTSQNHLITKSIEMLVDVRGFYSDCYFFDQRIRIMMVYCLLIYYILRTKDYIKQLAVYNGLEDIIKIRKDLLEYDVRYFYKNPILQSRHELYAIYELMAKNYHIIHLYEEMKTQTKDIAKIAEIELSEKKANQYKNLKTMINWIVILVTIMGALPAIDSAINIYNKFFR